MRSRATSKTPRGILAVLAVAVVLGWSCNGGGGPGPDVVLIVVDTLRADRLGQYGYALDTSPALEAFAAESTRFDAAYSTSSWTQPSVASLFTGLLPLRHGVVKQSAKLPAELETLAEALAAAGWQTAGWSGNLFIGEQTGFDRGFEHFEGHQGKVLVYPDIADMLTRLESWLESNRDPGRPGFLYFQPMNCHGPYRIPAEHRAGLLGSEPDDVFDYNDEIMTAILKDGDVAARSRVTPGYLESANEQYDTAVRYSTDVLERLLDVLRREGLYDDALVIVTSDHGEEFFEHGGFGHAYSLFEEVVRIPLWIKLPGQSEGAAIDSPVSLVDLHSTILEAAGLAARGEKSQGQADGLSLLPLLGPDPRPAAFRARPIVMDTRWKRRAVASAVRLGSYKWIEIASDYSGRTDARLLFDLGKDPAEQFNLASSEPEKARALSAALSRTLENDSATPETETAAGLDTDVLRALGYID